MENGSPAAPRLATPSWLDTRLVLGVLLVLVSVLVGAKALAGADAAQQVWHAKRDLAPGTVVTADDLVLGKVRLFGASSEYLTGTAPVGYVVQRSVGAGELLPAQALAQPGDAPSRRQVTVPVAYGHLPTDLAVNQLVDVYVTPDEKAVRRGTKGVDLTAPRLVLSAVPVARVTRSSGLSSSGQTVPVVLSVPTEQVLTVVQALADGPLDLVRVPAGTVPALVAPTPQP